jgi:large subunit ribosomal protein L25
MEKMVIHAQKRDEIGKGSARSLRRNNMIPVILYRKGSSIPLKVPKKELTQFINETAGEKVMVSLELGDGGNKLALLKDYQVDPVKRELLHADFYEVLLTEKLRLSIRVVTTGESIGVKRDGGVLQHLLREVEIECLPDKIPGHITVDVSNLEIGQSIHVKDLKTEEGVKILNDPDEVVVNVIAPEVEEAAPTEKVEEVVEPEVIKKGKKEEEKEEEGK